MITTKKIYLEEEPKKQLAMHPQKFALWLFLVSVCMLFAAFTSAFIVKKGESNWVEFPLPNILWVTTGIILLSSITMQLAYFAAKKDELEKLKITLFITFILGVAFLVGQYMAWEELYKEGIYFGGSHSHPSGSYLYVFTGLHAVHLISGIIFLFVMLIYSFKYKIHSKKMVSIEMCATYWHFLDALWIYLVVFLLLNH